MAFQINVTRITVDQQSTISDLMQKIEAINAEINALQILRRDAQAVYLQGFNDVWTPREAALAEERNKCVETLRAIRKVEIKEII